MRILIATDAWKPQVNGVVRSLESVAAALREFGAEVEFLTPQGFASVPLPTYGEIKLAFASAKSIRKRLDGAPIDHIHIATEGPVGFAARRYCLRENRAFTTSYHTRFPEYIETRTRLPSWITYAVLRRFHNSGAGVMVATASVASDLKKRGFERLMHWSRGVDHRLFSPERTLPLDLPRPIYLYAGRLAPEKNIESFLALDLPGSKLVVGDGPSRRALEAAFPKARFVGAKSSVELAAYYASSDALVFPSRTDTFGMVLIEALACGLPVAALPVAGPLDVIGSSGVGALDEDLRAACLEALDIPREKARAHALTFTWANSARQFLDNIVLAKSRKLSTAAL
ncbi:glycosyltransferase family 4 protein [Methylocella sp.]|uniref:glycosyltransferase family 4 protein n=1 Tax=Methylocella sp. TaxID=1978226 RepID=UPI0037842895